MCIIIHIITNKYFNVYIDLLDFMYFVLFSCWCFLQSDIHDGLSDIANLKSWLEYSVFLVYNNHGYNENRRSSGEGAIQRLFAALACQPVTLLFSFMSIALFSLVFHQPVTSLMLFEMFYSVYSGEFFFFLLHSPMQHPTIGRLRI